MTNPRKSTFYQTVNQPPRIPNGRHRRTGSPAHRDPADRAGTSAGGSRQNISLAGVSLGFPSINAHASPALPHAGVRAGELIGYRLWWLLAPPQGLRLCSLAHRHLWDPGETITGNLDDYFDFGFIDGGVYAFSYGAIKLLDAELEILESCLSWPAGSETKTLNFFMKLGNIPSAIVRGTVKMWGEVVEHEHGYRAQFAKVNTLDELHGQGNLDDLRRLYGLAA